MASLNKVTLGLLILIFMSACVTKRKCLERFPTPIHTESNDSTFVKDSVIKFDMEIKIAPIGSATQIINIQCDSNKPSINIVSDTDHKDLKIDTKLNGNNMTIKCLNEDSLVAKLKDMEKIITTIQREKHTKEVQTVEVPIHKKHIPKWVWYSLGLNFIFLGFFGLKIWLKTKRILP